MKLLLFLSLFFYQTLHANILYPLPTHEFDFPTSAHNYNSSNTFKKRTLTAITDKAKPFVDDFISIEKSLNIQVEKDVYLYKQVGKKDLEGVKNALKLGANPNHINLDSFFKNNSELTETEQKIIELIKTAPPNHHNLHLKNKLAAGVKNTILDNVIESLEKGADPNHRLYLDLPHLLQLALRDRNLIQELPLTEKREKIVEALLKHGADPNLYAKDIPPLHLAVLLRSPKAVKLLIKHGAKVDLKYNKDVTPLLLVVDLLETERNFERYIGGLNKNEIEFRNKENLKLDKEITQALLDAGADINEKTLGGNTLLVNAVIGGHLAFASFLILEKGANPEEAIEIIKKHQVSKHQLIVNKAALKFLENLKTLHQDLKKQLNEIKSSENDKNSCPGAFG